MVAYGLGTYEFGNDLYRSSVSVEVAREAADAAVEAILKKLPEQARTVECIEYVLTQAKGKLRNTKVTATCPQYPEGQKR